MKCRVKRYNYLNKDPNARSIFKDVRKVISEEIRKRPLFSSEIPGIYLKYGKKISRGNSGAVMSRLVLENPDIRRYRLISERDVIYYELKPEQRLKAYERIKKKYPKYFKSKYCWHQARPILGKMLRHGNSGTKKIFFK